MLPDFEEKLMDFILLFNSRKIMNFVKIWCFTLSLLSPVIFFSDNYEEGIENSLNMIFANDPDDSSLLLNDQFELKRYLALFPFENYKLYADPQLTEYYIDEGDDTIKDTIREGRSWETFMMPLFEKYIIPGSTAVDIGAHIGTHTITMSRLIGPNGKVIAFEPQRKIFRELYWNCYKNNVNSNVRLYRFAIGNNHAIVEMNKSTKGNEGNTEIGSGGDLVELRTLDSFHLENVSLIKIDVEMFEDNVLFGAKKTILKNRPIILIELMGGYNYDTAPEWVKKRIDHSKNILFDMGYNLIHLGHHDYLAIPNDQDI